MFKRLCFLVPVAKVHQGKAIRPTYAKKLVVSSTECKNAKTIFLQITRISYHQSSGLSQRRDVNFEGSSLSYALNKSS